MNRLLLSLWNFWPPFFGAGIKIDEMSKDLFHVRMRLKLRFWNRNIVGTQYGGSIYSMTDPIYMTLLMNHLGRDYVVWDKAATVRFLKPGKTDLTADFRMTPEEIAELRARLEAEPKLDWERDIQLKNAAGETVAEVHKVIHIRKKQKS